MIKLIAAVNSKNYIGLNNALLYQIPTDLSRFKFLTTGHTVVMGRKTWESLPDKSRPLSNRKNVVVTRDKNYNPGHKDVIVIHDLVSYLKSKLDTLQTVWIIGGAEIYGCAIPFVGEAHVSVVNDDRLGDVAFPILPRGEFICTSSTEFAPDENYPGYKHLVYVRRS